MTQLSTLIAQAPWREAKTYRDTWPHEYVLLLKDGQTKLVAEVISRFKSGEGIRGQFFDLRLDYLFVGGYKYWFMVDYGSIDTKNRNDELVLNRARLYHDRRDFIIAPGDTHLKLSDSPPANQGYAAAPDPAGAYR